MESDTSTMPPKAPRLTVEEDTPVSQVLEIIGGITLEAVQTFEEPEERDVWLMEEGDDSVFYSDEDQAHLDIKANTSCDFGANECEHLVSSATADEPIPQRKDEPGQESVVYNSEMEKEATLQGVLTGQGEGELQTPKTEPEHQSDPAGAANETPDKSVSACGESLQLNMQMPPEQNTAAGGGASLPNEEEEVVSDTQSPSLEPLDVTNEQSYTRLKGEAEVPEQLSSAERQQPGDRRLQVVQEPEQDRSIHDPAGFHQSPSPGYSTLPLLKKSSPQESFNHLTSTKYSTVSYRKIRRGNTRQKIEKFEYMMMNL